MKVTYYPGCSLEGTAVDYGASIAAMAAFLGVDLVELLDWNCCGASSAHSLNHRLALELAARNLVLAEKAQRDLVAPCALCFNRLKTAELALQRPEGDQLGIPYRGEIKIWDLLDYFAQEALRHELAARVTRPLADLKCVCYYGCLASRPPAVTGRADYENPQNMERLLQALGASPLDWSFKTDCCGAGLALPRPDLVDTLVQRLYARALEAGAECFVVSCQMCQANLDLSQERISQKFGQDYYLPVFYFTELMGLAVGEAAVPKWLAQHLVDPMPLLKFKGVV